MGKAQQNRRASGMSRRVFVAACIATPFVALGVASGFAGLPVVTLIAAFLAIAAPFGVVVALGSRFESTLYQDPNSPINQEFRGVEGLWPYGGGAIAVGFRDPKYGPVFPSVPDDDPHRVAPPKWLTDPDPISDAGTVAPLQGPTRDSEQDQAD